MKVVIESRFPEANPAITVGFIPEDFVKILTTELWENSLSLVNFPLSCLIVYQFCSYTFKSTTLMCVPKITAIHIARF